MGTRPKAKMSHYGRFRDGVSLAGIPVSTPHGGKVFWVDSGGPGSGTQSKSGGRMGSWNTPFLTLDKALDYVVADRGDVIFIKPGHAETYTAAGGITLDKAGCYIIGLGIYDQRPTFSANHANATILVTAADVWMENIRFIATIADVLKYGAISAKGFHCIGCHFEESAADKNFIDGWNIGVDTDNEADGCAMIGNTFHLEDGKDDQVLNVLKNCNDLKIVGNRILGDFDTTPYAPIYMVNTESGTNCLVADNLIYNDHNANSDVGIMMSCTALYGWMARNIVIHADTGGETPFLGGTGGLALFENYASGVPGTASAYLLPAVDS